MRDPEILSEVKKYLDLLSKKAPGHSVEVRIPPYSAIQCVPGPVHKRGTPRAVIEMKAETFLQLSIGELLWKDGVDQGLIIASGERTNLANYFPLISETF
jgi:alpha-D-ribose 1-methylphosphonate 5-triphosphate synthase subunit PhnL